MRLAPGVLVLAVALLVPSVGAQGFGGGEVSRYEALYGTPVDVSIDDILQESSAYDGRAVRTRGRMEIGMSGSRSYTLRGNFGGSVQIVPVNEVAQSFEADALTMMGQEVQITGVLQQNRSASVGNQPRAAIQFWKFDAPQREHKGPLKAAPISLQALVSQPGERDGQTVRVVGKFRGRNLYGDLPVRSQRDTADWVIKDDLFAVWVSGRKPKGDGFELDPALKRDTGKWIEVVGRVESRGGVTYLRAVQVSLSGPPSATADAAPPPPPPPRPKVPPVVVFALPLDGDTDVPASTQFTVQFSKDMDEATFEGRVLLRYVGAKRPGDREFDGMKLTYDRGRKALTLSPGDVLRPGRQLELVLLPGIADIDGLALVPRTASAAAAEVVDVLRFATAK